MANKGKKGGEDTYSYNGWLNSDKFLKRAFAIYGHSVVAGLIIVVPIYLLMFLFMGIIFAATEL